MTSFSQTCSILIELVGFFLQTEAPTNVFLKIIFEAVHFDWVRGLKNVQQIYCKTNLQPQAVLTIAQFKLCMENH